MSLHMDKLASELIRDDAVIAESQAFCESYKEFLNHSKCEREVVRNVIEMVKAKGFVPFDAKAEYAPGSRVFYNEKNKALILAVIGKQGVRNGLHLIASHIDSPRVDLKTTPLYEEAEMAYFKTHYYGSIRRYQWVTALLAMHGRVSLKDGTHLDFALGEKAGEPQFVITDLLPHLAKGLNPGPIDTVITGEMLNILIGSYPAADDIKTDPVKQKVLEILAEQYGIEEEDFLSAEICFVPAYKASDIGFDRSMIGAYGQDDKICAYPAVVALTELETPENTTIVLLADKEEVGNGSVSGMDSAYIDYFIEDLCAMDDVPLRDVLRKSQALSADVSSGFDPAYADCFDSHNVNRINHGAIIQKYNGYNGKADTNDAGSEYLAEIRRILDGAGVLWQSGETGRIDLGGGRTLARCIANRNIDVVDIGVPVLSMHSTFETTSKLDIYMLYKALSAFMNTEIHGLY